MKLVLAITLIALGSVQPAHAHDIDKELSAFASVYASKDSSSTEARAAKLLVEQAQAFFQYADNDQVLHIRSLTNKGLAAAGEPPASLSNELKRLEAAVANPKTTSPAKIAEAKRFLEEAKSEKAASDALEKAVFDNFKQAMKLLEAAKYSALASADPRIACYPCEQSWTMSNLNPMAVVAAIITSLATTFAIQRNASALRIGA